MKTVKGELMKGKEMLYILEQLEQEKGINRERLINVLEEAILLAVRKRIDRDLDIYVKLDLDTGDFKIYQRKVVVPDDYSTSYNPDREILLSDALKVNPEAKEGDVLEFPFTIEGMGRIAAQATKQVLMQRLDEVEREIIYKTFKEKEGDIIPGTVLREERGSIIVDLGKTKGILPVREQVKGERYKKGDTMKFYVLEVKRIKGEPRIILSRTHPKLVERLFEKEMPEVVAGLVKVMAVARDPGDRAKVAVAANDPEIDPVGACIGIRGARIQSIVRELHGENIDIVLYSDDPKEFIANALKPARVNRIEIIDEEKREARVIVDDEQFSLAIGRRGQNVRLAAKLTGWKIDIKTETEMGATSGGTG